MVVADIYEGISMLISLTFSLNPHITLWGLHHCEIEELGNLQELPSFYCVLSTLHNKEIQNICHCAHPYRN